MEVKTSELSGAALDWAVAKCEGITVRWSAPHEQLLVVGKPYVPFIAHRDWGLCGPIIEREKLILGHIGAVWECRYFDEGKFKNCEYGSTPLIAAMRCYVASKLGDTVDVPDELKGAE